MINSTLLPYFFHKKGNKVRDSRAILKALENTSHSERSEMLVENENEKRTDSVGVEHFN